MSDETSEAVKNQLAPAWDRLHSQPRFRPFYPSESVVRFLARRFPANDQPPARVLDLGCGAGRHALVIGDHGHRAVGLDVSIEGLIHTRSAMSARGFPFSPVHSRMEQLPFADQSFDGVISFGSILYTDEAGFRATVAELHRILMPGGRLLVVTRSTKDHRFGKGTPVDPRTFVLTIDETNEAGMIMHFLDHESIDRDFSSFTNVVVDTIDHTAGGGAIRNSDLVIEARR